MLVIKATMAESGAFADYTQAFPIYQWQSGNKMFNLAIPSSLFLQITSAEAAISNVVKMTGQSLTRAGTPVYTREYPFAFVKTFQLNGIDYQLWTASFPSEFVLYSGNLDVAFTVMSILTDNDGSIINQLTTSQIATIVISPSINAGEVPLIPSDKDILLGKIGAVDTKATNALNTANLAASQIGSIQSTLSSLETQVADEIERSVNKDDDLQQQITDEVNRSQQVEALLLPAANINVDVVTNGEFGFAAAAASYTQDSLNPVTGTAKQVVKSLAIASAAQAGIMSASDWETLQDLVSRVSAIEGKAPRFIVSFSSSTPSQSELFTLFYNAAGVAPGTQPMEGTSLWDITYNISYQYFAEGNQWVLYSAPVSLATNDTAGIVQGDASTAGKIFAESDGTMSVNGWDAVKTDILNNKNDIATKLAKVTTSTFNIQAYVKSANGLSQDMIDVHTSPLANVLVRRDAAGQINGVVPTAAGHLTQKDYVDNAVSLKQDKLVAGANITIEANVISASSAPSPTNGNWKELATETSDILSEPLSGNYFAPENTENNPNSYSLFNFTLNVSDNENIKTVVAYEIVKEAELAIADTGFVYQGKIYVNRYFSAANEWSGWQLINDQWADLIDNVIAANNPTPIDVTNALLKSGVNLNENFELYMEIDIGATDTQILETVSDSLVRLKQLDVIGVGKTIHALTEAYTAMIVFSLADNTILVNFALGDTPVTANFNVIKIRQRTN